MGRLSESIDLSAEERVVIERLLRSRMRVEETARACWIWTGQRYHFGHGYFQRGKRCLGAHRYAFALWVEPVPAGLFVLHSCDNPPCIRPDHLFLGTSGDNNRDRAAKGRSAVGADNGRTKISDEDVLLVRQRVAAGESVRSVARSIGVHHSTISGIVRGLWKVHVGGELTCIGQHPRGERNPFCRLTNIQVADLRQKAEGGRTYSSLAREFSITPVHARRIVLRMART